MCINWLVEANGKERFPFTCSMVQDAADVNKYNLVCSPKGVCFGWSKLVSPKHCFGHYFQICLALTFFYNYRKYPSFNHNKIGISLSMFFLLKVSRSVPRNIAGVNLFPCQASGPVSSSVRHPPWIETKLASYWSDPCIQSSHWPQLFTQTEVRSSEKSLLESRRPRK